MQKSVQTVRKVHTYGKDFSSVTVHKGLSSLIASVACDTMFKRLGQQSLRSQSTR